MSEKVSIYKGQLNTFKCSQTISFKDSQSGDYVEIRFKLQNGENGFYSEEYKPPCDYYNKRIDITCGILDYGNDRVVWRLYDVKTSLTGEDVIIGLFEQFDAGYYYLKSKVLNKYKQNCGCVGVFTSDYNDYILKGKIERTQKRIDSLKDDEYIPLGMQKRRISVHQAKNEITIMKSLLNRKFTHSKTKETISIDLRIMEKINGQNVGKLDIFTLSN